MGVRPSRADGPSRDRQAGVTSPGHIRDTRYATGESNDLMGRTRRASARWVSFVVSYTLQCPKCRGVMRTYNRSGVQIEQCDNCRGIFLDYGELEAISRLEAQFNQPPPPPPPPPQYAQPAQYTQPAWGAPHGGHHGG